MFNDEEKLALGRVVFDSWADVEFSVRLRHQPNVVFEERGIRDPHNRGFVVLFDTENTVNLTFPWSDCELSVAESLQQAGGLIRLELSDSQRSSIAKFLVEAWKQPTASSRAAELLAHPEEVLGKLLGMGRDQLASLLNGRRILTHEDTSQIVHFVVPVPPADKIIDLLQLNFEIMNSACCLCADDC